MNRSLPPLLALLLLLLAPTAQAQSGVWIDVVPVTRRLFGAEQENNLRMSVGWSTSLNDNGWRLLTGISASKVTNDNFGTSFTGTTQNFALRTGRRWFKGTSDGGSGKCRPVLGADLFLNRDHIGSESSNPDFSTNSSTNTQELGISAVLGVNLELAPRLHLVCEARLDGAYQLAVDRQEDSFGGSFEQRNSGWRTRLDPPLQLFVILGL